jgi:two-component sensor histidine kinase
MVRAGILETGRYAHLTGNSGAFHEAGLVALKMALIDEGLYDRNINVVEYTEQLRKSLHQAISQANKSLNYDTDGSGTVETSELQTLGAIPIRRY